MEIYEIKDVIDSLYGCDCAYYGVDGIAIATVLVAQGYRRQSEVAKEIFAEIEKEIKSAIAVNYKAREARMNRGYSEIDDNMMSSIWAKINTLRGILDFIKELKIAYEVDSDETN